MDEILIYLGEFDTKNTGNFIEPLPVETYVAVEKLIHPNFRYMSIQPDRFDIALLRLERPVKFKQNILPICLPEQGKDFEGYTGIVAGWGKTDTTFGKFQMI